MQNEESRELVRTWDELAEQLGTSRRTIARMMKIDGRPEKVNGMYDVQEWQRFREQYIEDSATLQSLPKGTKEKLAQIRIRRDTAVARREELLLAKMEGKLVDVSVARAMFQELYNRLVQHLKDKFRSIPQLNEFEADKLWRDFLLEVYEEQDAIWKAQEMNGDDTPDVVQSVGRELPPDFYESTDGQKQSTNGQGPSTVTR